MNLLTKLAPYYKAVAAFCSLLVPFITAVATALSDGSISNQEWVTMAIAFAALIGGTKAVYQSKNIPSSQKPYTTK